MDLTRKWSENDILAKEDIHLPFIMKIMSIRTTLSLQVHPTKVRERIHVYQTTVIYFPFN